MLRRLPNKRRGMLDEFVRAALSLSGGGFEQRLAFVDDMHGEQLE
jgi:hypothetical protein